MCYMLELTDLPENQLHGRRIYSRYIVDHVQFSAFLSRFGPIERAFAKASLSFFSDEGRLVTWFHGTISRKDAEAAVGCRDNCHTSLSVGNC
jgi:hypothetical protein